MVRILVEANHNPPLAEDLPMAELEAFYSYLQSHQVIWLRSFVSRDRCRTVDELEASDVDTVQNLYRQARVPLEKAWIATILES